MPDYLHKLHKIGDVICIQVEIALVALVHQNSATLGHPSKPGELVIAVCLSSLFRSPPIAPKPEESCMWAVELVLATQTEHVVDEDRYAQGEGHALVGDPLNKIVAPLECREGMVRYTSNTKESPKKGLSSI